jgi:lia operon protein LiaG
MYHFIIIVMNLRTILYSAFIFLFVFQFTEGNAQNKKLVDTQKTFDNVRKIEIEGGNLDIEYVGDPNSSKVEVTAYLESNNANQDILFISLGDVLKIKHHKNDKFKITANHKTYGLIKIKGPVNIELLTKVGSGKAKIENVNSKGIAFTVGSGILDAKNITANLNAVVGSGSIKLQDISGNVDCKIGSGDGNIQQTKGVLNTTLSSGTLKVNQVEAVHVTVSSGSVKLDNIGEIGEVNVSSGSVRATNSRVGNTTKLNASSGSIRIQTPQPLNLLNYDLRASSGNIKIGEAKSSNTVKIKNGDFPEIRGAVSSGNISITN